MTSEKKQEIMNALKAKGKVVLEEHVELMAKESFETLEIILPLINPTVSGIVLPILNFTKPMVFDAIDKIDGIQGN